MRYSFRSLARRLAVLSIALAAPSAAFAQAATMTFGGISCTGMGTSAAGWSPVPSPYTEAGYTISAPALGTWCSGGTGFAGPNLWINGGGVTASLTKNGGGPFSINSISLAHWNSGVVGPQSFTFIGNLFGGGTVTQTFTVGPQDGSTFFTPFAFNSTFTNLASVTFAMQTPSYYQFTNVLLNAATTVPEPASMALLGTGLVGVFGAVRRRRNESA